MHSQRIVLVTGKWRLIYRQLKFLEYREGISHRRQHDDLADVSQRHTRLKESDGRSARLRSSLRVNFALAPARARVCVRT